MIIKVCGMREADNIREVEQLSTINCQLSINWMGFIFWPRSSRYVSERPDYLPIYCKRVGVFVDEDIEQVKRTADEYQLDLIQLHGHERPDYIRQLSDKKVIKAFNIANSADLEATKPYEGIVDYFLFDAKGPSVGGNGAKFDWTVLADYVGETPFLLSGGIGPDDAQVLTSHLSPLISKKCVGIDLNSRFEITPGLKDINKLKEFIKAIQL